MLVPISDKSMSQQPAWHVYGAGCITSITALNHKGTWFNVFFLILLIFICHCYIVIPSYSLLIYLRTRMASWEAASPRNRWFTTAEASESKTKWYSRNNLHIHLLLGIRWAVWGLNLNFKFHHARVRPFCKYLLFIHVTHVTNCLTLFHHSHTMTRLHCATTTARASLSH
jgi:hypothetical protein